MSGARPFLEAVAHKVWGGGAGCAEVDRAPPQLDGRAIFVDEWHFFLLLPNPPNPAPSEVYGDRQAIRARTASQARRECNRPLTKLAKTSFRSKLPAPPHRYNHPRRYRKHTQRTATSIQGQLRSRERYHGGGGTVVVEAGSSVQVRRVPHPQGARIRIRTRVWRRALCRPLRPSRCRCALPECGEDVESRGVCAAHDLMHDITHRRLHSVRHRRWRR
jgi:hypothetical protein